MLRFYVKILAEVAKIQEVSPDEGSSESGGRNGEVGR